MGQMVQRQLKQSGRGEKEQSGWKTMMEPLGELVEEQNSEGETKPLRGEEKGPRKGERMDQPLKRKRTCSKTQPEESLERGLRGLPTDQQWCARISSGGVSDSVSLTSPSGAEGSSMNWRTPQCESQLQLTFLRCKPKKC